VPRHWEGTVIWMCQHFNTTINNIIVYDENNFETLREDSLTLGETRLRTLYLFCNTIADDHYITKGIILHPKNDTTAVEI